MTTASRTTVFQESHWEDADLVLMARIRGLDAQEIIQSTISSISLKVFDLSSGEQVGATAALTVASVVFDILQTDDRWTKDGTGYNFRTTVSGAYFSPGDRDYRIEVVFTPATGSPFPLVCEVSVQNLMGS
jgi:hypothetical protein